MYTDYFNLKQQPFSIAPDPRYLFMSERHREALAHLLYGIGSGGGFVLLTGEIGAGKTTVCRCFIEQVPDNCRLAYIFNPKLTVEELLLTICDEFRVKLPPASAGTLGVKGYVDAINGYLLDSHAQGNNNVLVIDEAQNLSPQVLEQLRLLTNLETSERKLLQIILIGQPELRAMLAQPELEQLAQRVIARYHLGPLSASETGAYVAHRLTVAGAHPGNPIPGSLAPLIHRLTNGVPRRINLLCDRALLGAYVENSREVTPKILRRAAQEVFAGEGPAPGGRAAAPLRWPLVAGGVLAGAAISAAAWQVVPHASAPGPAVAVTAAGPRTQPAAAPSKPAAPAAAPAKPLLLATQTEALRELGTLWGQQLPTQEPCQGAPKLNLRCYQGRGGLYELRLLDRPAIVALHDGQKLGYAVLTAVDENSATLSVNGQRQKVSLGALAARFDGEYTTLWKVPRAFREEVHPGDTGADVDWIAGRLAELNKREAPPIAQPLDDATRRLLRAFQSNQNLKADGVAGPRTYMRLNQLSGVDEPRLLAANGTGK
ncbi:peptidoglycan-binding protein [Massilia sp. WF1]|uniref:ExeA family protein n=1 Tax=unclassified Massilia TaxID=2609279 RepID=UPI00064B1489|nr:MULTISPECIES: AAA family ATPase [unclassified Massilia]ALK96204.1 peptidoglycan-binding protein [Massilia sp. WG5]KLU36177.1 peptidoglycan-binding protein [Massilia sp. WF1]